MARQLKVACGTYFGSAGPEFVRTLITSYEDGTVLSADIRSRIAAEIRSLVPQGAAPEQRRAMNRFALVSVAGQLAAELDVIKLSAQDIRQSVAAIASSWLKSSADLPDYVRGALNVRDFVQQHESRFRNVYPETTHPPVRNVAGYRDLNRRLYLFTNAGFKEACSEVSPTDVARELARQGYLETPEPGRFTTRHLIDGARTRVYAVRDSVVEYELRPPGQSHERKLAEATETAGPVQ